MTAIPFDNSYARLPERFYRRQAPTPVTAPRLVVLNVPLAEALGIDPDWLASEEGVAVLAGNRLPEGAEPIATAYGGHQFGHWNPYLGDGRAILLGEVISPAGERFDLQLKGAGPTPFSRMGDGRAPLGPVLREYLVSEAMAALGIPTTRSLAVVLTGEVVYRERPLPGAILCRVARSHIRIGHFQYFFARRDLEALDLLLDHVIDRHYPELRQADNPALALLEAVVARQAALVARWEGVGFVHGVMNTDNMLVCGDTIDYGPCAFLDAYDPAACFSSIDHAGRYAFHNQPAIAHWNLACFAQALLPLIDEDESRAVALAQEHIDAFPERYRAEREGVFHRKLGFAAADEQTRAFVTALLDRMAAEGLDYTCTFRALAWEAAGGRAPSHFSLPRHWQALVEEWRALRGAAEGDLLAVNPARIPRNHQIQRVIEAAERGDFTPFFALAQALAEPWTEQPKWSSFDLPPAPDERVRVTFCGT
ncbi:MAG: UPF0061 protein [Porticoccaceae bacterium]|nr:MAG: UPF0061 protein [Porticoccaceae bacterium]